MNDTVAPAITPANAWPTVGSLCGGRGGSRFAKAEGDAAIWDGEKSVRWSSFR